MSCKIEKNKDGKIINVLNQTGQKSTLFQQILSTPTLTLNQAIQAYQNVYSKTIQDKVQYQVIGEAGASRIEEYKKLLNQAKQLEKEGKDYSETGWFKTPNNEWKYFSNEYVKQFKFKKGVKLNQEQNFEDVIEDNIIFQLYPEAKKLKIVIYDSNYKESNFGQEIQKINGAYSKDRNTIYVNINNTDGKSAEHIIGHELNHFTQGMEGFSTGGSKISIILYALNSTNYDKNVDGDIREYLVNYDRTNLSKNDIKIFDTAIEVYDAFDNRDDKKLLNYYDRIEGEVDSRAVELAITLKNKFNTDNVVYEQLTKEILKRDGIDANEVISLYYKGFEYSEERDFSKTDTLNKLKETGLADNVFELSQEDLNIKLVEIGEENTNILVSGFIHNKDIYLNKDTSTEETQIHEFNHLYQNWLKQNRPQVYQKGIDLISAELENKNSSIKEIIDFVKTNQPSLTGERLNEEILTELVGRKGLELLIAKKESKAGILNWLSEVWQEIKNMLGLSSFTDDQILNMNLNDFANASAVELLRGESIGVFDSDSADIQYQVLSDYRDNTRFKYSDLIYPDVVFKDITNKSEAKVATGFYKKIINKFNKTFNRDLKIQASEKSNDFTVTVEYETGLKPKYFAYPTATMGEHETVDNIDKNVPLTSLRHELIHEMLVKNITDKFERINNLDNSANIESIEEVQRNRAYNYTLEDVFFERVVENIERNPDNKDTFEVSTFSTDIINRVKKELGNTPATKENVLSTLEELLQDSNPWLKTTVLDIFQNKVDYSVNDLSELNESVGKAFKQRFDLSKDIFTKELQSKIFEFATFFNEEYTGVLTRLNKIEKRNKLTRAVPGNNLFSEPLEDASKIADEYMSEKGMPVEDIQKITKLDTENSKKIAQEFDKMEVTPNDPETKASYKAMVDETLEQYEKILSVGYKLEVNNSEPYNSSSEMINDLRDNKRMRIFSTESGFGGVAITEEQRRDNPLLQKTTFKDVNGTPLLVNDIFRFVHDFFGHAKLGNGFGAIGEENAWNIHSKMYSPLARRAMTTETRGQNSWVNFSGVNDEVFKKRDRARTLRQEGKIEEAKKLTEEVYEEMSFAEQKIGLLPEWVSNPIEETNQSLKAIEPNLSFETPSGETFTTYQDALKATDEGKIKLNIEEVNIAEVDSDTNVDNFEGVINHLVKQGGLTGERILDKNGDIIYVTQGQTETAKQFTAELVEKQAVRLLGRSGVKTTKSGDFIFTDTLNKITINGQEYNKKDIDSLNYEELTKKFGKQKALEIELGREYTKALQPTKTKKRLEETSEVKTEDELVITIKSLLNKLGIKITSIEDYIKHNTLKNDNVAPEAKALMDVVNKIMAFRNGTITREDLIEETMHFIEASLDPKLTEGIRRNISKTAEWKQYSEHYFKIYSKEYSGEKLDEMVRREILGKVMANAVINNFALSQNATLTEQSIFDKIKELLQQFFDTIEAFFKPQYQQQIDVLNNDIFAKLMAGTLINEMNTDQNYGTKFRLYSVSNDITNDIVRIQKEAEKALDILRNNITQIGQEDSSQNYTINVAKDLLKKVEEAVKKQDDKEARIEAIATFAKIVNMVQRQTRYLERASKKATQNKHPFSAEEMIVYNNLVSEFYTNIIPTVENILGKQKRPTPAEKRIQEELEKAKNDISELIGTVQNSGFKAKDYVVDLMVTRLGLDKETEDFLRERAEGLQQETNWFFMQFGNLSHSSNVYLNALGHIITKADGDKREGFQKDLKPFIERISKAGYLKDLSSLADGDYLQSVHLMNDIDNKRLEKEYSLYYELFDKQTGVANEKVTLEEFKKIDIIDNLDVTYSLEFKKQMDEFELKEYKLSPLNLSTMLERREKLKNYSQATQDYERNASGRYASIMQQAEIVDGIPLVTQDMRYEIEDLRDLRVYAKSIYDRDGGKLKQGISLSNENESNAIQIGDNLFVTLSENANNDAILAVELSQIDFERIKDNEGKPKSGMTDSFRQMLSKMDAQQAYDFLMLNSYVNYTDEYYNSLNIEPIVTKLENAITDENEGEILPLIEKITAATTQINTILKANKMMNSPSEINFDRMEMSERQSIKDLSQDLEYQYSLARQYLSKEEQQEEEKVISETIPNQAFIDYLVDTGITSRVDYSGVDRLDEDQIDNINKIFNTIEQHSTENKVREILNLKNDVKLFKNNNISKFSNVHKRAFKLTIEEYNSMEAEERFAYMTNELLQYSYTKLLPYFRKSQPIGVDVALTDLRAGVISSEDFLNNYDNGQYEFLKITPNYNFQEATNDNNKNPHFQNAKVNNTPLFRVFEETTTLQDVQTKSIDQLKQEGKLNAYTNIKFLKEYNIDLVELFQTGKEVARSNKDKFEARQALLDLQKISLEKNKVLGKHNLYLLPQKEASKTKKFDKYLKSGKNFKTIYEEIFNFREDDADLGQDAGKAKVSSSDGNYSIPKYGLRRLKNAPVTDDLLESYTWMNYKANEHQARRQNVGDAMAVSEALMGSEFEGNIQKTTSNLYKTFKESMDYNFFGVKEVWSSQFKLFGIQMDYAKLLRNFGQLIRFRNLGFTLISPITSAITGSIFLRIESLVGQTVDKDALRKANSFFTEHAGAAAREMLGLEPKAMLNSLGEFWGWHDSLERYENSMYGKGIRGIQKSAFAAHSMANFPINTRVGLAVLANSRFVEGEMLEYKQFAQKNKGKSEKEIRGLWANYTSVLDVVEVQKDGVITYNYTKVAQSLNNNFTEEEAKNFMDDKRTVIKGRIKAAIQNVDGQISTEDKSMSTRNVFFSFMNIHRSWLMIAVQNKLKYKQVNLATGHIEEGSWRTIGGVLSDIIKEARQSGVVNALTKVRSEYKNFDDYKKRAISRTLWEAGVLNLLIGLTLLGIKELDDDEEDSWMFKIGALFTFRTTNEVASSTVALPRNIYDTLNGIIVGLNTIQIATDAPDLFSSDIVERGRYKSLTERERYFFKHIPMMRDYNNLWRDTEGNIKSYNYFNFTQSNTLDWMPTTFLLKEVINEEE